MPFSAQRGDFWVPSQAIWLRIFFLDAQAALGGGRLLLCCCFFSLKRAIPASQTCRAGLALAVRGITEGPHPLLPSRMRALLRLGTPPPLPAAHWSTEKRAWETSAPIGSSWCQLFPRQPSREESGLWADVGPGARQPIRRAGVPAAVRRAGSVRSVPRRLRGGGGGRPPGRGDGGKRRGRDSLGAGVGGGLRVRLDETGVR